MTIWHINADKPRALHDNDYNQPGRYSPDAYRSSDHKNAENPQHAQLYWRSVDTVQPLPYQAGRLGEAFKTVYRSVSCLHHSPG